MTEKTLQISETLKRVIYEQLCGQNSNPDETDQLPEATIYSNSRQC